MPRIRPASLDDAAAICQLNARTGMGHFDVGEWREFRETYPFAAEFPGVPVGWVLETEDGSVVGNLDNIRMLYEFHGQRVKAAVAANWIVDPAYRGKATQMMTTFFRQTGIDLNLNVSASPAAAQILTAMKIPRIPIPDYATPCFWAVRPQAFAKAVLLRKAIPGAAVLAWPAGLALRARDFIRKSAPSSVRRLREFDPRFDERRHSSTCLRAVRTRALLEWRFRPEMRDGRAAIVAAERGSDLLGYAILLRREDSDLGMNLYDIADLQAADDAPSIVTDLLLGSIQIAREEGADAVKFMSGTPAKRGPADRLRPYTYRLPLWQQYFKASPELTAKLSTAESWDFSRFDTF